MVNHSDEHDGHFWIKVNVVELSLGSVGRAVEEPIGVDVLFFALVAFDQFMDVMVEHLPKLGIILGNDLLIGAKVIP